MSRFYISKESIIDNATIVISGSQLHHIKDVMRLKKGDEITAFDDTGREFLGVIDTISPKQACIAVHSLKQAVSTDLPKLKLVCAIPKLNKMDYIVQKATELGVDAIIPVVTERTIVALDGAKKVSRLSRWERIAIEASKQCGRPGIPKIKGITGLDQALKTIKPCSLKLIACLDEKTVHLKDVLPDSPVDSVALLIGPEGDFTPSEIEFAVRHGCKPVSLGQTVLKCDTAAIAASAIILYHFLKS